MNSCREICFDCARWRPVFLGLLLAGVLLPLAGGAAERVKLEVTPVSPAVWAKHGEVWFADFGRDAFGNLQLDFPSNPPAAELQVRLGEKLAANGAIDREPGASVNYREVSLSLKPDVRHYQLQIPTKPFHNGEASVKLPPEIGEVTPFRYAEIEGLAPALPASAVHQLFVHAPFNDQAAAFESSDATLNAVWELCRHTMKATTVFGVYIDGERERIPYEADAYINQLSHYAFDLDPRVARYSVQYLLKHPTWPTEWSFHLPMMAAADYLATGDPVVARDNYLELKAKLLLDKARADGLIRAGAIVDWPEGERDGYNDGRKFPHDRQLGPEYNTVVNAFQYHALQQMEVLARALHNDNDADQFKERADLVYKSFNRVFFDKQRGLYVDGEGSQHVSLHGNLFALAFGLVPEGKTAKVADFVQSKGMACSVYGAQYLLTALFESGRDVAAVKLLASRSKRSWWHMIELGSTMTLEAWDPEFKRNLTWNHAWGAAPANLISRFVLGVTPLEPGYAKIQIAPQLGELKWVRGKVPTAVGPVGVRVDNGDVFKLSVDLPTNAVARVILPRRDKGVVTLDGEAIRASKAGQTMGVELTGAGHYVLESR
jgi:alpha-L-rhamnosidase